MGAQEIDFSLFIADEQSEAAGHGVPFPLSAGTYYVGGTAQNIESLTPDEISAAASAVAGAAKSGTAELTSFAATDASVVLTSAQAVALEDASLPVTVPKGDTVRVADTAANLDALTLNEITALQSIGVTAISGTDARPVFNIAEEDALANKPGIIIVPVLGVRLTVSQLLSYEANPTGFGTPDDTYYVSDTAAHIEALTAAQISAAPLPVTAIVSTGGSVVLTVSQALALEADMLPVSVPTGDRVTVVDTAAKVEALSLDQLQALHAIGVDSIAASNALPVFSAAQMNALGHAAVAVIASPGSSQNDGTSVISGPAGNGMTFDITWDSSVASAPASYKLDVEQAFQFYADVFKDPVTLYYNVGFGESNGHALGGGDLGQSNWAIDSESYPQLLSQLTSDATSPAQLQALASLPATDPTSNPNVGMTTAEAQTLGFANAGTSSAAHPDGEVGFSDTLDFNYSSNPNQVPLVGEYDFFGTVEHEISEVMGRDSFPKFAGATIDSLMDLFRYASAGQRQLSPAGNPAYFSIDNGTTNLDPDLADQPPVSWNNRTLASGGDLGDWGHLPAGPYTPDAFNNGSDADYLNPFSSSDATLMNVLGYDLAAPTVIQNLPPNAVPLTVGQFLTDLSLDQITPGSNNAPPGKVYDLIDTAFDIESLTAGEITAGAAIGVAQIYVTDATVLLDVAQAKALGAAGAGVVVPADDAVIVSDSAAKIEAMTAAQLAALASIGVSKITSIDASVVLTAAQAAQLATSSPQIVITVPAGDKVTVADTAANITKMTAAQLGGLWPLGIRGITATGGSVAFNVGQAVALEDLNQPGMQPVRVTVAKGKTVTLAAGAANIGLLTSAEISALPGVGITAVTSTGGSVVLTVAQAEAFEAASLAITVPAGDGVILADTAAHIEGMSVAQRAALPSIGVTAITVTDLAPVAWAKDVSGNWTTAADWSPAKAPDDASAVTIAAGGIKKYTVSSDADVTVYSIALAVPAILDLTGGTFNAFDGTGSGTNSGVIKIEAGATLELGGSCDNVSSGDVVAESIAARIDLEGASINGGKLTIAGGAILDAAAGSSTIAGATMKNAGILQATGGGLTIDNAVTNTGTIRADGGNLAILGKLAGSGHAEIFGTSTLEFGAAAANAVTFESGSTSLLRLDAAQSFSGTVAGLSSGDSIDLANFLFSDDPTITKVAGTAAAGTTTNVTIKDGTQSLVLKLVNAIAGEFAVNASAYSLSADSTTANPGTLFQLAAPVKA